jgi:hypothetical protein
VSNPYQTPPPVARLKWAGIDLDGTLAEPIWTAENPTSDIGDPIWHNVAKANRLHQDGWKIVIHTSRAWTDYAAIEGWLNHYGIPFRAIICGKGLFGVMIDDRNVDIDSPDWSDPRGATRAAFNEGFAAGVAYSQGDAR